MIFDIKDFDNYLLTKKIISPGSMVADIPLNQRIAEALTDIATQELESRQSLHGFIINPQEDAERKMLVGLYLLSKTDIEDLIRRMEYKVIGLLNRRPNLRKGY